MSAPAKLAKREQEIMEIVFSLDQATLTGIQERMENAPTRAALRSLLTILERKGHLTHAKDGREFVYRATQPKQRAGRSALRRVLDVFFGGSLGEAVAAHFSDPAGRISDKEMVELEAMLDVARKQSSSRKRKS